MFENFKVKTFELRRKVYLLPVERKIQSSNHNYHHQSIRRVSCMYAFFLRLDFVTHIFVLELIFTTNKNENEQPTNKQEMSGTDKINLFFSFFFALLYSYKGTK